MAIMMAALFFITPFFFLLPAIAARAVLPELANPEQAYAAIAMRVLPQGIMGLLLAAMFASTVSCVAAEFNVTAGVFTRDVYHRLLRRAASPRELLWTARGATLVLGGVVMLGALFVGRFGGAFTANMILTGLAIPLSVPLVLGILVRRARPWSAFATVLLGVPTGIILNLHTEVSWPVATLTVIAVSVGTMLLSGLIPSRNEAYCRRVAEFFTRLTTPIAERDKPHADPAFRHALAMIFVAAFVCVGVLFLAMGLPSLGRLSGSLALGAGGISLGLAYIVYCLAGRQRPAWTEKMSPATVPEQ